MNRSQFYAKAREAFGGFTQSQVDGINQILDEWDRRGLTDKRWLAYILATVWHETGRRMQPISELGGETYLRSKPYYPWYGRGLVQITWQANYEKFGIANAADALNWPVALRVLFDGMTKGLFTGSSLEHWFSATVDDPFNARRIVNGADQAPLIAGYHRDFLAAVKAATTPPVIPPVVALPHLPPTAAARPWWKRLLGVA